MEMEPAQYGVAKDAKPRAVRIDGAGRPPEEWQRHDRVSTSGKATSPCTLGSQFCFFASSMRLEGFHFGWSRTHCSASAISIGYVEAANTTPTTGSGYKAIGATRSSSC